MDLYKACKNGDREQVDKLIEKGATDWGWNLGLSGACEGGHLGLVNFMIEKGATMWDGGLDGACYGGHLELANLMIEKGATNWSWGLWGACKGGQLELANFMIEKGANMTLLYNYELNILRRMRLNKLIENHLVRVENRKNLFIVDFQSDLMNRTEKYL